MEKTLRAVDELSGFLLACAYVRPEGIVGLTPKSVKKKLKQPSFAAAVNRDDVRGGAEVLGVDFDEHVAFVIAALEARADELELRGSGTPRRLTPAPVRERYGRVLRAPHVALAARRARSSPGCRSAIARRSRLVLFVDERDRAPSRTRAR